MTTVDSRRIVDNAILRWLQSSDPDALFELWRLDRLNTIASGTWPGNLRDGPGNVYVHIVPTREIVEPLNPARDDVWQILQTLKAPSGSGRGRLTFDGYLVTDSYNQEVESYAHWFYDRRVELVIAGMAWQEHQSSATTTPERWFLDPHRLQAQILKAIRVGIEGAYSLGTDVDLQVGLAVTGVIGVEYRMSDRRSYSDSLPVVDRDRLLFPLLAVDGSFEEFTTRLRPWLDRLWQAGGYRTAPE